jgi:hypothetical protein
MNPISISNFEEFEAYLGKELGASDYFQITQTQINCFAEATLDHQWIHTDPIRIWQHHRTWLPHTQHCTLPLGTNRTGQQPQNDDQLRNRKSSICSSRHRG